ncbi:hypothetical protein F751_1857 [Auxenochlorella protothecoides]|uniref:Uncharacterized protein n=1 Tax=Auxenochlorella protothecoides TaxID=3075 RepID=A0A087SGX4_AUXPR|nr:hypothetical protein F751_1857 [Auxenochlorella protothecoides]KFM24978.1 hypothetical protein F751_1857 [Auxenochlorella protothecoides]
MYNCTSPIGIDPRNIAQRIMEIRSHIAKEMAEDLSAISEENARLMRESLTASLSFPAFSPEEDSPDGSGQPAP